MAMAMATIGAGGRKMQSDTFRASQLLLVCIMLACFLLVRGLLMSKNREAREWINGMRKVWCSTSRGSSVLVAR